MNQGNITFTGVSAGSTAVPVLGANKGLSIDLLTSFAVLGQDVGDAGNPAFLASDREIPYTAQQIIMKNLITAGTDMRFGLVSGGRIGQKINGANGAVATHWLVNASAATFKDWQWEATTANLGQLVLNDNVGNLLVVNRNNASLSSPFHCFTDVLDTAVNLVIGLTPRSRYVITNRGAAANIIITLPSPASFVGRFPDFVFTNVSAAFQITIQATGGALIRVGAMASLANGTITTTGIGDTVRLQLVSATEWIAVSVVGNWVTP